ncbi:hypothetical protein [Brevundimonas sp. FT23042]|uniref:hypothetical protein n=1 Tax=Brevundimonas sp. FT23042 TaxID=3393749 RepID=UPI003B587C41
MLKFAVPAVAALGLIAFAAQSRATDVETGVPGMGWHLSQEGAMAKLAYGVENSDQLALMMTCEPGDRRLALYGDVLPASPRLIQASSRESAIDPLSGDLSDEAAVSLRDPTLREMARTGRLTVEGEAGQFQLTANAQERVLIERFFAYCGTEHV